MRVCTCMNTNTHTHTLIVPGVAPGNVAVQSESSTSIRVDWRSPPQTFLYGMLRNFSIQYSSPDDPSTPGNVTELAQSNEEQGYSIMITGLLEYTNYSVQVSAVTVDSGPYSDPVIVQTDQDCKYINSRCVFVCAHV